MKKTTVAALAGALLFMLLTTAQAEYKHKFTGATKCKICHMSKKRGDQWGIWLETKHAKAYETLTGEEAKKVAEAAGQAAKPPQDNPACLKCHVAGWDAPAEMLGAKYDKTEGVTCEACHGPGEDYSPMKVMRDPEQAKANGLVLGGKEDCLKCHNKESPTYKPFDFATFWAKIKHEMPKEEGEAK